MYLEIWLERQFRVSCMYVYLIKNFRVCIDMYLNFFVYFRVFSSLYFNNIKIIIKNSFKFIKPTYFNKASLFFRTRYSYEFNI